MSNLVHSISFAIPSLKWNKYKHIRNSVHKTNDFSMIIPGGPKNYSYDKEDEYIAAYAKSYVAVTFRKGGVESLRHYEILLAGTLPYFLHIDLIPEGNLCAFPKDLLKRVINLPGMPSEDFVIQNIKTPHLLKIDHSVFSVKEYETLRQEFLLHVSNNVLCTHMVRNVLNTCVLNTIPPFPQQYSQQSTFFIHSLYFGGPQDYQRDLTCVGILELGYNLQTSFDISYLFEDYQGSLLNMYGRGFTYGRCVDSSLKKNWTRVRSTTEITPNCIVIVSTKSNRSFPNWNMFSGPKIFIHGDDDMPTNTKRESPDGKSCIFYRELGSIWNPHTPEYAKLVKWLRSL